MTEPISDRLCQPLYDTVKVTGGVGVDFFSVPVGQGETVFGFGPKHFGDTNMYLQRQMPAGWQFRMRSLYIEPIGDAWSGSSLVGTAIDFRIGPRNYLTIPYERARVSLMVTQDMADTTARILDELKSIAPAALPMLLGSMPGVSFGFDLEGRHLIIRDGEPFSVRLMPCSTGEGVNSEGPVRVYLNGELGGCIGERRPDLDRRTRRLGVGFRRPRLRRPTGENMKAPPSALAVALALIEARVNRLLAAEDYSTAMNQVVDLHMRVRELQEAEHTAASQPEKT
jgi:hypothetical protein